MSLISLELNRRSVLALVACDLSYVAEANLQNDATPLGTLKDSNPEINVFPRSLATDAGINLRDVEIAGKAEVALGDWVLKNRIYDSTTGFSVLFFHSAERNEYIVALTGTNGPDGQDWYNNLNYSTTQWSTANQQGVEGTFQGLRSTNPRFSDAHITFAGQSLGGALAQYAAYDFVQQNPEFNQENISLITFNGLGAYGGLRAMRGDFNTELLAEAETAHYVVYNDIASRLGEGNFNAAGNTFLLDFRALPGQERALHFVDAHRIESGFYRGFEWGTISAVARDLGWASFSTAARAHVVDYLNVSEAQKIAAAFGQLFNDEDHSEAESWARLVAGVVHGLRLVPQSELEQVAFEFIEHLRRASAQPDARHWAVASVTVPAALKTVSSLPVSIVASAYSLVLGIAWDVGEDLAADLSTMREKLARLLPAESYDLDLAHSIVSEPDFAHTMFKALFGLKVIEGGFLKGLNLGYDANQILGASFFGTDWLMPGLRHFVEIGRDAGMSVAKVAVTLSKEVVALAKSMGASGSQLVEEVVLSVSDFVLDVGKAIANAHQDFITKIADTVFGLGRTLGFAEGRVLLTELESELRTADDQDVRAAVNEAMDSIESAGQTIVVSADHPETNPFDAPDFDPDAAPPPQKEVKEGGIKRFTLSLPYGAGEGGQAIAVTLNGTAAPNVRLLAGGEEVLPQNDVYTVTVASGERELELSLLGDLNLTEPGVTEAGTLSLSATLVDSAGQATHQTHVEANVEFGVREDLVPDEPLRSTLTEGNDTVLISTPLSGAHLDGLGGNDVMWGDSGIDRFLGGPGDDRLYGSFRLYFGANDSDWLSGGAGNDQLLGHEGDDLLEGDSGSDAVLGDIGNDVLFAGSQADYATIFTLGGADDSGDLVQGGAGDDLVVGSAGADALSGGNGTDLILGGGGNDEIRGDTEFVPTHTFHIIGTTFPPEQPFAGGADVLYGNAGDDILLGEAGDDRLYGGEGFDNLTGGEGKDELYGGAGDDFLVGDADSLDPAEHADDYLHGGEGSDVLLGHGGDDTLVGDAGDDFLEGGDGNDSYVFNRGDGADTVFDFGSNTVRFGPGIDATDLKLGLGSLFIRVGEGGDAIRIVNFDPDDVLGTFAVDVFEFLNGERLSYPELIARGFDLEGTNENDFVRGTSVTDRITGGEGNDELDGAGGMDILAGGPGDDIYHVDDPGDAIEEAIDEGHDSVQSTAASYVLGPNLENLELIEIEVRPDDEQEGDGGEITITGGLAGTGNELDNEIDGNSLNNVLDGGGGNDRLAAESGSDTYIFGRGSGADTIVESDEAPGDVDAIQVGSDVLPGEVTVLREENDLILAVRSSPDRVRIQDWFVSDAAKIELAFFDDGTAWDSAMLEAMAAAGGTNSAPVLVHGISDQIGFEDAVFSFALPADAFVDADMGDTLTFGATLEDGAPLPGWLSFDGTSQVFSGMPTNDDVGAFDIAITATDGGGLGAADIFRLTVENTNDPPALAIAIADQNTPEDALFNFTIPADTFADVDEGDALTMSVSLAGEGQLPSWLVFDPETRAFNGIPLNDHVGTWNLAVTATDSAGATATADLNLTVENVNDPPTLAQPLSDQSGNQNAPLSFQVPEGAFLDVDAGDALLFTATRADDSPLPEWLEFDGVTRLFSGIPSEFDIGALEIRVTAADMAGASVSDDFALSISDASVVNETHSGTRRRDVIVTGFANDLIDADRGDDVVHAGAGRDAVSGGRGHDHLFGEAGNDMLAGGEGHDHLLGGLGEDLLAGGDGHDRLEGGEGHDVYLHERHGGHDTIEEQGNGFDALLLGEGITPDMARLEHRHDDLVVDLHGDHGSVTIKGWFASDSKRVETIQFADGTTWGIEEIRERASARGHLAGGHDDGDHGHHHHHSDDDDCHEASSGKKDDDREHDHAGGQRDRAADYLTAYLADEPLYDFEVLARDLELSDWRSEALSPREIARRWNRIASYAAGLSHEQDDDSRGGAAYRFDGHGLLGGALGGGFGYAGSTGATRSAANMRTLEGLKEGFHRLHD